MSSHLIGFAALSARDVRVANPPEVSDRVTTTPDNLECQQKAVGSARLIVLDNR